ncbi:N-acetylmuramoyl-L-alanine amidase [Rivularia sp. PCC 7116]|uniref:N-acetylmuramoyl-L-alanine amidase n=1 Tax=Rivularia sp. PCC 7116 TaxID=373994 RepID=UPI00029EFFDC|nr:N-acetylmuramoyl-L-alanine amidase [Rivularia sp. PCC 7116]AFY54397.1 N-acetylmuramoyl-L-alanine amidase [Rivularia sp. PCC 7116]
MKIAIDLGHNVRCDGGAVGIKRENDLIMAVGENVIYRLRKSGHQVVECKPTWASSVYDSLNRRVQTANSFRADVFASIHFNAFNGQAYGTEVYAISTKGKAIARKVVNNISALGYYNRGVKHKAFHVLRYTSMPAILVECCFCDSWRDMNLFDADKMAQAILRGLLQ